MFSITPDEELGRIIKRLIKYFDVGEIKDIEKNIEYLRSEGIIDGCIQSPNVVFMRMCEDKIFYFFNIS